MTKRRLLDWRLFFAVGFMLLVGFVVWSGINAAHRADDNGRRADAALATMQQHDQVAQRDRDEAARDRRAAAQNQQALLDYTATLAARQDALLAYLRAHGIYLPQRLVTEISPPRIIVRHQHGGSRLHSGTRRHRSSGGGSTTTAPTGPGKSGSAPGHHKHPRRKH